MWHSEKICREGHSFRAAIVYSESRDMLSYFIAVSFTSNETDLQYVIWDIVRDAVYHEIVTIEK